jgi:MYXO-CTERM domain-containing protein
LETGDETITIDLDSDPPLEPGQTYYVALAQKNCTINTAGITGMDTTTRISATVEQEVEIDGGVPVDGGDPDGGDTQDASAPEANGPKTGGCGCSQPGGPGGPGGPASVLLFLALLAGLWLRRSCLGKDTSL